MSTNYSLEVISHHPQFANKSLRKYQVKGIDTVGAYGDEKFSIRFRNHTSQKVQVKLSLDGTDIFTGKPASTETDEKMWMVNAYGTLDVSAWPENDFGGASFVFTNAGNSVAAHLHGDMSSRGIIAAAVFTEGHVEPAPVYYPWFVFPTYTYPYYHQPYYYQQPYYSQSWDLTYTSGIQMTGSCMINNVSVGSAAVPAAVPAAVSAQNNCFNAQSSETLISEAAIGAGQYVDRHITYAAGLIKPVFAEVVRVKYLWWDDLKTALNHNQTSIAHASGFPGDNRAHIDLKNTPRLGAPVCSKPVEQVFSRV